MHNFVSGPNFRLNLFSLFRETNVFVSYLFINEMIVGPLLAEGNWRIENHFFMCCPSLKACLVRQILWCGVSHNCYKYCNWNLRIHSGGKSVKNCDVEYPKIVTNAEIEIWKYTVEIQVLYVKYFDVEYAKIVTNAAIEGFLLVHAPGS